LYISLSVVASVVSNRLVSADCN